MHGRCSGETRMLACWMGGKAMPASTPDIHQYTPPAPIKQTSKVNSSSCARNNESAIPASACTISAIDYDLSHLGRYSSQISQAPRSYEIAGGPTVKRCALSSPTRWLITSYLIPATYKIFLGRPKSNWALMTSLSNSRVD